MSLELALAENTAAIKELIAVLKNGKVEQPQVEQAQPEPEKKTRAKKTTTESQTFYYRSPDGTVFRTVTEQAAEGFVQITAEEYEAEKAAYLAKNKAEVAPAVEHGKTAEQAKEALDGIAKNEVTVEYPTVIKVLTAYSKNHGRQGLLDLLAKFGAKTVPELKPDQYAAVVAAAEQA